jgi:hypothetical protein
LSAWLLDLGSNTDSDQSVVWLELLQCLWGIVDKSKTGSLSTTELSLEAEDVDLLLAGLVDFGKLSTELVLGDVCAAWVQDVTVKNTLEPSFKIQISLFSNVR